LPGIFIEREAAMDLVGSIKNAIGIAKMLYDSGMPKLSKKIAALISTLADTVIEASRLRALVAGQENMIADLKTKLHVKENLQYEKPCYRHIEGDKRDGPFSARCHDADDKRIRMQNTAGDGYYRCRLCNKLYPKDGRRRELETFA
jgi:hypothetical protein